MTTQLDERVEERTDHDAVWQVVVRDDPVNTMNFVVYVFRRVFTMSEETATALMLEVHERGSAVVWTGSRSEAEKHALTLTGYQLWARAEQM